MQEHFISRYGDINTLENKQKYQSLIKNQLIVIENAKKANIPIALIEYSSCENCPEGENREYCLQKCVDSGTLPVLMSALHGYEKLKILKKNRDSLFYKFQKHFDEGIEFLISNDVGKIIFMGANGGACVKVSIRSAFEDQKCDVVAYTKGIIDFNDESYEYPYPAENEYNFMYKPSRMSYPSKCSECSFDVVEDHQVLKRHF